MWNVSNVASTHHLACNTCGVDATSRRFSVRWVRTLGYAACSLSLLLAVSAHAQQAPVSALAAPVLTPDLAATRAALTYVQQRLRRWRGEGDEMVAPTIAGASAVCVTLRMDGRVIARADGYGADSLEAAVSAALDQAASRIPAASDALQVQAQRQIKARVLAGVEVAGERLPLQAATFAQTNLDVKPGLEAIFVEVGGQREGEQAGREVIFPLRMLHSGDVPAAAIVSSIARVSGDPAMPMPGVVGQELGDLQRSKGVRVWRAPVLQMVELTPGGAGVTLTRGSRVVELREVNLAMLRDYRERLMDHIESRVARSPDGSQLFATYHPMQDRADDLASPLQRAVLCATLARSGPRGRTLARELLGDLFTHNLQALDEPTTAAASVVTLAWLASDAPLQEEAWSRGLVRARATLGKTFVGGAWSEKTPAGSRAMIALGLAHLATALQHADTAQADRNRAGDATRSLMQTQSPGALVTHMPWLGYAQQQLAEGDITSAPALREMRSMLWERSMASGGPDRDLEGGIVFGARDAQGVAGPTWNTSRPLAFAAAMLRDPRLTDEAEVYPQLSRMLPGLRFLRQLAIDEAGAFACPQPRRAMWGVRAAPWDWRQPIESSAMTLLVVSEAIESLEVIAQRVVPPAAPAPAPQSPVQTVPASGE